MLTFYFNKKTDFINKMIDLHAQMEINHVLNKKVCKRIFKLSVIVVRYSKIQLSFIQLL
jgi:hypothetical protein